MKHIMNVLDTIRKDYDMLLASSSPRRLEILQEVLGFQNIHIMKPSFEENLDKKLYKDNPIQYVVDTCKGKSTSILEDLKKGRGTAISPKPKIVICADTVVIDNDNVIYEKPGTKEVQFATLSKFCDSPHPLRVVTAVNVILWINNDDYTVFPFHQTTRVFFDSELPKTVLKSYVESGDGLQVAGGFKIQGFSAVMIKMIEGDYYNVVGLPANGTMSQIIKAVAQHSIRR
ncbi:HCL450Wp [Eremothecium sinecaudum]|uniref:HCL450Wp n=1 Tax=Eremothecium sinecaudum TaxID=45286 RepID=A0A109UW78_9SACH|nr:HCL450Wp [Eremothecium sinecaudum]AMD19701.1 HCL450Wp [Eremothecium sinecaudum]